MLRSHEAATASHTTPTATTTCVYAFPRGASSAIAGIGTPVQGMEQRTTAQVQRPPRCRCLPSAAAPLTVPAFTTALSPTPTARACVASAASVMLESTRFARLREAGFVRPCSRPCGTPCCTQHTLLAMPLSLVFGPRSAARMRRAPLATLCAGAWRRTHAAMSFVSLRGRMHVAGQRCPVNNPGPGTWPR